MPYGTAGTGVNLRVHARCAMPKPGSGCASHRVSDSKRRRAHIARECARSERRAVPSAAAPLRRWSGSILQHLPPFIAGPHLRPALSCALKMRARSRRRRRRLVRRAAGAAARRKRRAQSARGTRRRPRRCQNSAEKCAWCRHPPMARQTAPTGPPWTRRAPDAPETDPLRKIAQVVFEISSGDQC